MTFSLNEDLHHVLTHAGAAFDDLRGARLLITGGTGFFGRWLLETFVAANDALGLGAEAVVLSRRPDAFRERAPELTSHRALTLVEGDVRTFARPPGRFSHVIHAATDASAGLNESDPLRMIDTIVAGTQRVLEVTRDVGAEKVLITSSGAVYGRQPPQLPHVTEEHPGGPDPCDPRSAYAEGKRAAETMAVLHGRRHGYEVKVARCFAFVGPFLPLDIHYAIGNFIRDGVEGGHLIIRGDGTPYRSYLYAADLAVWLWTILTHGRSGVPYNVGSDEALSIREVAERVGRAFTPPAVIEVLGQPEPGRPAERYVPSIARAGAELGLSPWVGLDDAIAKTIRWARATRVGVGKRARPAGDTIGENR